MGAYAIRLRVCPYVELGEDMKMEYNQEQVMNLIDRFYLFLRNRDAKIIELFFLGLHLWVLVVFALPPHTLEGPILAFIQTLASQYILVILQTIIVCLNLTALLYDKKYIRIVSSFINVAIMLVYSTGFALLYNPNVGTYFLLGLLAAFVCWKVNINN